MLGILTLILQALGPIAKGAMTFAKWVVAQGRLLATHAWLLWSWWLKYSQHSIVLRVAVWAAWTAAIEGMFALLSRLTIEPLSGTLLRTLFPTDGSGLLWSFWEEGLCLKVLMRCLVAYLGLYLALQAAVRQAQTLQRQLSQKWVNPRVFAR